MIGRGLRHVTAANPVVAIIIAGADAAIVPTSIGVVIIISVTAAVDTLEQASRRPFDVVKRISGRLLRLF